MRKPVFEGVCTALVTPFKDGHINLPLFRELLFQQMEAGIRAFVICGTTGEAPVLSKQEKLLLFREAKQLTGAHGVILAGTGSNCTEYARELSIAAQGEGADGLLVVTPYYNKCTETGLLRHYEEIAAAVSVPLVIYNVPSRTGVNISPELCRRLSEIPNISGIKEASPDLAKAAEIIRICPPDFSLYSGNDDLTLPILSIGGKGVISVLSNLKPAEMKQITDAYFQGDPEKSREIYLSLLPLMKAMFREVNPIPVKAAMALSGNDCGEPRLPLTQASQDTISLLEKLL